jgi:hypothetical protein
MATRRLSRAAARQLAEARANVELEWTPCQTALIDNFQIARRQMRNMAIRIALVCLALFVAADYFVLSRLQELAPHIRIITLVALMPALMCCIPALFVRLSHHPIHYAISRDGILLPSKEWPFIPWKSFDSFTLAPHPRLPGLAQLNLHRKTGVTRLLSLPDNPAELRKIASTMAQHLPERAPLKQYAPLAPAHWIFGLFFVIVICIASAVVPIKEVHFLRRYSEWAQFVPHIILLLGPGTIASLCLIGRRGFNQLFRLAIACNLLAFMLISIIFVILETHALLIK